MEIGAFTPKEQMLHFHDIFKYMIYQRRQNALLWSKGLNADNSYNGSVDAGRMPHSRYKGILLGSALFAKIMATYDIKRLS